MKRVLFVCVENSNRSQMAEAFARIHGACSVAAFSAGFTIIAALRFGVEEAKLSWA